MIPILIKIFQSFNTINPLSKSDWKVLSSIILNFSYSAFAISQTFLEDILPFPTKSRC